MINTTLKGQYIVYTTVSCWQPSRLPLPFICHDSASLRLRHEFQASPTKTPKLCNPHTDA